MLAIGERKPRVTKGRFLRAVSLRSTNGDPVALHLPFVDPESAQFMQVQP